MNKSDTERFIRDKKDKEKCYNYLVAEFCNLSEDEKTLFLNLKYEFEVPEKFILDHQISDEEKRISNNLSCYRPDVVLECVEKLISVFDIKYPYSAQFITGAIPIG